MCTAVSIETQAYSLVRFLARQAKTSSARLCLTLLLLRLQAHPLTPDLPVPAHAALIKNSLEPCCLLWTTCDEPMVDLMNHDPVCESKLARQCSSLQHLSLDTTLSMGLGIIGRNPSGTCLSNYTFCGSGWLPDSWPGQQHSGGTSCLTWLAMCLRARLPKPIWWCTGDVSYHYEVGPCQHGW